MMYKKIYFENNVAKKIVRSVNGMTVEPCGKSDEAEVAKLRKLLNIPEPKVEPKKEEPKPEPKPIPKIVVPSPVPPAPKAEEKKEEKKDEKPASGDKAKEA